MCKCLRERGNLAPSRTDTVELFRAEKLYTAKNYQTFINVFRKHFPNYLYYDETRGKELITAPLDVIQQVFVPRDRLVWLQNLKNPDSLQAHALRLIDLISKESGVSYNNLGIHGSIAWRCIRLNLTLTLWFMGPKTSASSKTPYNAS